MVEDEIQRITSSFERKSIMWLAILVLLLSFIYIATTLGSIQWVRWVAVFSGYMLVLFLVVKGGIYEYFQEKKWRRISFGDFLLWTTLIFATILFINTTLIFQSINDVSPEWLIKFSKSTGLSAGIGSAVLSVIYILIAIFKK